MSSPKPSVEIYHPVLNIEEDHITHVQSLLTAGWRDNGAKKFRKTMKERRRQTRKMFKPAQLLRNEVIVPEDILRLHQYAGIEGANEEHMDELSEYLVNVIPDSFKIDVIKAPTLPLDIREPEKRDYRLTIAGSQRVLEERSFMKKKIAQFYGLNRVPERVWLDDAVTGRVQLAEAQGSKRYFMLSQLAGTLVPDAHLLPDLTELGGVVVEPHPQRQLI